MPTYSNEFLAIALIHFLAVASPGPDFAIMLKQSISYGRKSGLWTSFGIGMAIFLHVSYCVLGLGIVISKSIIAFNVVKYLGALYLVYIGFAAIKSKPTEVKTDDVVLKKMPSPFNSFWSGFMTNALNPKATLFFLAVFSVTVSPRTPAIVKIGYGVWMAFATIVWFSSLSYLFSRDKVRSGFKRFGHWFERSMGIILIALGIRLALIRSE